MKKQIYVVESFSRVIGEQVWQKDMNLCAYTNKENALRYCANKNENNEGIFLEWKYEVHVLDLFD